VVLIRRSAGASAEVASNEAPHKKPELLLKLNHDISRMVWFGERGVAGKKERWRLLTRRLHGHGTFPIRNLGIYTG
jgi:hypothetical protein